MTFRQTLVCCLMSVLAMTATIADDKNTIHVAIGDVRASSDLRPVDGITSSGQPDAMAFAIIAESGYVAVIDVRGPREERGLDEQAVVEELGMEYIAFPLANHASISMQNAERLDEILSTHTGQPLERVKADTDRDNFMGAAGAGEGNGAGARASTR